MPNDLFRPPANVSEALANKLATQHARADIKQREAAVADLTAMRDQYHTLIGRGGYRPDHQLQLFRRRAESLDYAITQLTEEP